jgi:hypothetical protein
MAVQGIDNWEYARWLTVIGRSMRLNPPAQGSGEAAAAKAFVAYEYGKRPWLRDRLFGNSQQLQGLVTADNSQAPGKNVEVVGRDILRVPVQDMDEKARIDVLIAATGSRRYGGGAAFGGAIGADVDQTP